MNRKNDTLGTALLLFCAVIWGAAFAMQEMAAKTLAPSTVLFTRSLLSVLFLIGLILVFDKIRKNGRKLFVIKEGRFHFDVSRAEWFGGTVSGVLLFAASYVQQFGLSSGSEAGMSGFITSLYMVFVPIFGVFLGKKITKKAAFTVLIALLGFYFISVTKDATLVKSDLYILLCAVIFSGQILAVDKFSEGCDGVRYSFVQFFVCTVLSAPLTFLVEKPTFGAVWDMILPLLFLGFLSGGVAYTLQIVGQQLMTSPTLAGVLMSLENVFALLTSLILFPDFEVTGRQGIGCVIVCAAVLFSQIPTKAKKGS
ncbi:MAG: DMT family transporter [Clostridia bacterium]|nr:DMT family transporter [Clostridia bacterium]